MKKNNLSVGIISRFRSSLLNNCLLTVSKQSLLPDEVIIVLDHNDHQSFKITDNFNKKLKIRTIFYNRPGYAPPRNLLLDHCRTRYLYLVDDDCMLRRNNIHNSLSYLQKHSDLVGLQGRSVNIDNGFYSQFMQWTYELWNRRLMSRSGSLITLDTKNLILDLAKLNRNDRFNECFGSEDVDFGLQLNEHHEKVEYFPSLFCYHSEQTKSMSDFIKKKTRMRRGRSYILNKWGDRSIYTFSGVDSHYLINKFKRSEYSNSPFYVIVFLILFTSRSISGFHLYSKK